MMLLFLFFLALSVFLFRDVIPADTVLLTTDDNIGELALRRSGMPGGFLGGWNNHIMAGLPQLFFLSWSSIVLWLTSPHFFSNWMHAIDLVVASVFLCLFLRRKGFSWLAGIVASLAAFWLGSNFTLVYAGHIGKFGVLAWASASLWLFETAVERKSVLWSVLCGGALSLMLLEQPDVALFFDIVIVSYFLFRTLRMDGIWWKNAFRQLVPLPVMVLIMAAIPLAFVFKGDVVQSEFQAKEDPASRWEFATQWSWPPEESIDFIAPGYMGWRSGEQAGPYYGRMGRSDGWEETGQGFMNFKLENQYLGALSLLLAFFACLSAWVLRKRRSWTVFEIAFWIIACVLTLLLSFGKYFPLYRLFYQLPMVVSIRNPNKFLQVFQLCLGVLCAYGFRFLFGGMRVVWEENDNKRVLKRFLTALVVVTGFLAFTALIAVLSQGAVAAKFAANGFGSMAQVIARNRIWALWHAVVLMLVSVAVIWFGSLSSRRFSAGWRLAAAWSVVLIMVVDVSLLARHYVKPFPMKHVESNELTETLKASVGPNRTAFAMFGGADDLYRHWQTYLFPYHNIKMLNVVQMPRMPRDYAVFFERIGGVPFRLWQQFGVTHVIAPAQLWNDMQGNPQYKDVADIVLAFNVRRMPDGVLEVVPGTAEEPGMHCVLRLNVPSARLAVVNAWQSVSDEEALALIVSDRFSPILTALVAEETAADLPESVGPPACDFSINVQHDLPGRVSARVFVKQPSVLRFAERYDPDWKVFVNETEKKLLRVDYLFQGVFLNVGVHHVEFVYSPSRLPFAAQALGWLICFCAVGGIVKQRKH